MTKQLFTPKKQFVNRYTRAGKSGKQITCPKCSSTWTVFHFSWYSLTCQSCLEDVNKSEWEVTCAN